MQTGLYLRLAVFQGIRVDSAREFCVCARAMQSI